MSLNELVKNHNEDRKIDNFDIDFIIRSLKDPSRIIRQIAFQQLSDLDDDTAKQALWHYHPYDRMQCLRTLIDFNSTITACGSKRKLIDLPQYFGIANYSNKLVCYWSIDYKYAYLYHWNLVTGEVQKSCERRTHEFGLGQKGKITIDTYQDAFGIANTEDMMYSRKEGLSDIFSPTNLAFDVCPTDRPLLAIGHTTAGKGECKIIDYEKNSCLVHHEFEKCSLFYHPHLSGHITDRFCDISPILFTPNGKILFTHFCIARSLGMLQIWDIETGDLIKTLEGMRSVFVTKLAVRPDGTIIACGIRDEKVCAWELLTDRMLHTTIEIDASTLSPDGRIFAYGTSNCDLVLWDLMNDRELCRLVGHTASIGGIAISLDREFIATYSTEHSIKIWGIPELEI